MKNFTFDFIEPEEILSKLDKEVVNTSQTLIQLFCASTNVEELKQIQTYFADTFSNAVIIGTTTDGIINSSKVHTDKTNVASFTVFNNTRLKATLLEHQNYFDNSFSTGSSIAKELSDEDTRLIISFTDGLNTNGEEYANGISSVSPNVILAGGLAGDNGELYKTYVFDNTQITSSGAVGVSLSSDVLDVTTLLIGCQLEKSY